MRIDNMVHKVVYSARNREADAPKMNAMHKMLQSARNGEAGLIMKCLVLCRNRCLAGAVFSRALGMLSKSIRRTLGLFSECFQNALGVLSE